MQPACNSLIERDRRALGARRLASSALAGFAGGSQRCVQPRASPARRRLQRLGCCGVDVVAPRRAGSDPLGVVRKPVRRVHRARLSLDRKYVCLGRSAGRCGRSRNTRSANGPPAVQPSRRALSACWATGLATFAVYEAALFVVAVTWLGGTEDFTAAILGRIFVINAAAFVGLLVLHRLAVSIGFAANRAIPLGITGARA